MDPEGRREIAHQAEGEVFKALRSRASSGGRPPECAAPDGRRRRKQAAASARRRRGRERGRQGRPGIVGVAIASSALLLTLLKQAEATHFNHTWCAVPLLGPNDDPQTACETACATSNPADTSNEFTGTHWYTTNCIYHQSEHVIHRVYMEHMPRVMEASPYLPVSTRRLFLLSSHVAIAPPALPNDENATCPLLLLPLFSGMTRSPARRAPRGARRTSSTQSASTSRTAGGTTA